MSIVTVHFLSVVYGALRFCEGVSKSTFSKYYICREGVTKKRTLYALDNGDYSGRPLRFNCIVFQMLDEGHVQPPGRISHVYQWLVSAIKTIIHISVV